MKQPCVFFFTLSLIFSQTRISMPRNTPCRACQKRQKGCFWRGNSSVCNRCKKLRLECVVVRQQDLETGEEDVTPREYVETSFDYWNYQVQQLEIELAAAEQTLRQYQDCSSSNSSNSSIASTASSISSISSTTSSYADYSSPSASSYTSFSNYSNCTDDDAQDPLKQQRQQQQQQQMEWKLTVENGLMKLQTTINTMEELFMYSRASLRYLSPFRSLFKGSSSIRFENPFYVSTTFRAFRFMFSQTTRPNLPSQKQQQQSAPTKSTRDIIDQLVQIHLKYKNPKHAFLHGPSFLKHYESLRDPLTCPITLALCVDTICTTRRLDDQYYTSARRHHMASFFYERCKAILAEMFDDPDRKIETIIAIHFLKYYIMFVLLQPREARRLVTVAYLLCKDLEQSFTYHEKGINNVSRIIVQRHLLYNERLLNIHSFLNRDTAFKSEPGSSFMDKIPGEDGVVGMFIDMNNRLVQLSNDFHIKVVVTGPENMSNDDSGLNLETIIRSDEAIKEWWASTPTHLRLCYDLYADNVSLSSETDWMRAVIYCFAHVSIMQVHVCLLKPICLDDDDDSSIKINRDVLAPLREQARETVLRSCELLFDVMIQILSSPEEKPTVVIFELISRAMNALVTVSSPSVSTAIHQKLYKCINAIYSLFPSDTLTVPPSLSPLKALTATSHQKISDFTVYRKYPLPGYALFADILHALCANLQSHLVSTSPDSSYLTNFMYSIDVFTHGAVKPQVCT
ncbi:hypothetical protein BDB00DRAFT_803680 [Zychaea mexicana]|uniref:uncharacterized protein n=1 Tax=Zychaea mexicana TaxID=64656 RepID=UPI0022FE98D3|nr:uncharacterized protein BDB00DRAFT_803680 [Zychaea mexicana]KAI9497699.1 hypothetical protein BDB00DRAFT_803680 [Zychaea mexicana]